MFDDEEKGILQALEEGCLKSSPDAETEIALAKQAAKNTLSKTNSINSRSPRGVRVQHRHTHTSMFGHH